MLKHESFSVRTTYEACVRIGELLLAAKRQVPKGQWGEWCKKMGLGGHKDKEGRKRQYYMQAAKLARDKDGNPKLASVLSGDKPLSMMGSIRLNQSIKRQVKEEEQRLKRQKLLEETPLPHLDDRYRILHADNRTFDGWPQVINHIATDPPWQDVACYRWLAHFAKERLALGGLLLCQVGNPHLSKALRLLEDEGGLSYLEKLVMTYKGISRATVTGKSIRCHSTILVLGNDPSALSGTLVKSDTYTVMTAKEKDLHPWQQPLASWRYWLSRLTSPGQTLVDPFAGSGTNAVAAKEIGDRVFLGTEMNEQHCRIAQNRLAKAEERSYEQKFHQ